MATTSGRSGGAISLGSSSWLISSGYGSLSVGLGIGSMGMAGPNGIVALTFNDGHRSRVKVGYVGEDLKANCLYTVTDKGEWQEVPNS